MLAVQAANRRRVLLPEQRHLLETFAGQIALALERIQLAHAAESSRVEAETESLRNTLLASISHDLRTPLAVIAGAGSTLADPGGELDAESRRKLAQSIETRARDMSDLISNVLDLTRLESDRLVLRRDWQTIDDLLGAALERSGERLRDHRVEFSLPPDLPAVHVDATLTVQLFANLFENAAKYTPAGTRVSISARADERMLEVIVEDDGPGLPAGDPDRLFNKFQRGRSESEVTGAGLGLAICRAIARAHGGDIRGIESRRRRRAVRGDPADRGTRGMTTAMHQVLVVEDEPGIRAVVRLMLQSADYRVIEADTAARAEIEARTHRPDLLIVDLGLPDGDGLDVIRRVRAWSPVPIIVLSARIMEEQKVAALDAGADDFVSQAIRLAGAARARARGAAPLGAFRYACCYSSRSAMRSKSTLRAAARWPMAASCT